METLVAVIGGDECSEEAAKVSEEVGRELAKRGIVVVCGGRHGVMEAVCRGAKAMGGTTVGILPGDDRREANPCIDIPIVTGMGYARNPIVVKSAQAVIAIDGSFGTLSEIAYALQNNIPVIGLNTWSLYSPNGKSDFTILAENAKDAVDKAVAAIRCIPRGREECHDHR